MNGQNMSLDAGEVYSAVKQFDLVTVAKEIYSVKVCVSAGSCVLSVAVVRNSSLAVQSLQGLRSCHSGVRWTAGWSIPLGFLLSRNYLKVGGFFSASCCPGAAAMSPALCTLCQGQKSFNPQKNYHCETSQNEPFYNTTPSSCLCFSGIDRDMFRLLCPDGTQAPVSRYRSCNLGRGPGGAVVTRYNFRKVSRKFLLAVQVFFFSYCGFSFKLFESEQFGESDLLFKDATNCFVHTSHMDLRSILGEEFHSHLENVFNCTHSGEATTTH
uniref:Transferrin-like domain-containing protein n=1 Tax=Oryzias latipes TaxID=8090 RepID=A0A3B3HML9_ORYLA